MGRTLGKLGCSLLWRPLHNAVSFQKSTSPAVTRIRTWVTSATTKGTNHYTITATGIDKITISFLRSLFSAPYIFVSTPSILYHKREGGPTLTVPLKVCVGRGGGSKGHYLAVSKKSVISVINFKSTLSYLLCPSSCVYQYTLEVPMHW